MATKNIYSVIADVERYRWLTPVDDEVFQILDALDGQGVGELWKPLAVEKLEEEEHEARELSDFPYLNGLPVLSARAVDSLHDLVEPHGELLPLLCPDGEFYLLNVTRVLDGLDEVRSVLDRFASSGRVKRIVRYQFLDNREYTAIFRIPQSRRGTFVTDPFVERVSASALEGFEFNRLWP